MEVNQRTVAEIHLDRLARNIENVKKRLAPGVEIIAVVKGDAYGHGAVGVYPTMQKHGIHHFAVAIWEEGATLREAGLEDPILILGDTWDDQLPKVVEYRLTPTIFSEDTAEKLNECAKKADVIQPIHIKIDTGMSRIGFLCTEESAEAIQRISRMSNLKISGLFSHFPRADDLERHETEDQFARFNRMREKLKEKGVEIPFVHMANSTCVLLRGKEVQLDAVRVGDILYGLSPIDFEPWEKCRKGLEEILSWQTYVVLVKTVPAGTQIGYGGTYVTEKETKVATIPVGFLDGYSRNLSNCGHVIIRDTEVPIIGRVCMDQFMVDVTDLPEVKRGDKVMLLDGDRMDTIRLSTENRTSVDETVCAISKRVPRIYTE